ncbi:hypothetical protein DL769_009258 [Monosporascus sp. CRB-8-3]|nr:hypothetical protein DL769_009258 [Monosporascus sp. CRB-8-3]
MLSAMKNLPWDRGEDDVYVRIPLEEGRTGTRGVTALGSVGPMKRLLRTIPFCQVITFVLGIFLGLSEALILWVTPSLTRTVLHTKQQIHSPSSVIPREVFSPKIPRAWVPDARYVGFSEFSNSLWHNLVKTTESVWIEKPKEYGLGKGFEAPFNHSARPLLPPQFYHVSNLHQLHCLNIIRGRYFELYLDLPSLSKQDEVAAEDTAYHMDHCIEYLRMSIMCGGSWDVESSSPPGTPTELRIDPFGHPIGWGGIRNCVNWDTLMTWQKGQVEAYKKTWPS